MNNNDINKLDIATSSLINFGLQRFKDIDLEKDYKNNDSFNDIEKEFIKDCLESFR